MGSWGYKVDESDTFSDVYDHFFDHYNNGATPEDATQGVRLEFGDYLADDDDQYDAHFALALAQWETQSLEPALLVKVQEYIESGAELRNWEERGADSATLQMRRAALAAFLKKLGTPRRSKKRQIRPKFDFREKVLVEITAPDDRKTLSVSEEYTNGKYVHTGAMLEWSDGGGSVFYFTKQGAKVSARWIDSQNLEVCLEAGLAFSKKNDRAFFCGDEVHVRYSET